MAPELHADTPTQRDYKQRLLRVLVYIQQNLDRPLELDELAQVACFSPYHFHRIFTGMIGESVQVHIRRLRLERAVAHLKTGKDSVLQIALGAGYETHEAFTRAFKGCFGIAPAAFRSRQNALAAVNAPSHIHWNQPLKNFRTYRSGLNTLNVQVKQLQPLRVAFMRHVGPYNNVGATWEKLCPILGKEGWLGPDALFLGVCYDDPEVTSAEKIRYDACLTVDKRFIPHDDIGLQVLAGGDYAVTTHFGPYETLNKTYARLFGQWLPRSGRKLASRPCFEVYLNSPNDTAPKELLTDICMPLEAQSLGGCV